MRAAVRFLASFLILSALLADSAEAQRRRRPRARAAAAGSAIELDEQVVRGSVPRPELAASALFGASAPARSNAARARRAFQLLGRGDRAAALAELSGIDPAVEAVEVAYVVAWARFLNGDFAGAASALGPAIRRARVAQVDTLRNELAWMNAFAGSGVAELTAQLESGPVVLAVAERMVEPLLAHGQIERAAELLEYIGGRARGRQLAAALEREARVDFARGSPNVGAIRLAEAIAIARSAGDTGDLERMRAHALEAAERADRAWALVRDARSRIAATILYRVWLRSGGGPRAAEVETTVEALERPSAATAPAGDDVGPLRGALDLRIGDLRGCYERALATTPDLRGRVVLRLAVSPAGEVSEATVVSAGSGLEETGACIATRASTWRVPAGSRTAPVTVSYPIALSPAHGG